MKLPSLSTVNKDWIVLFSLIVLSILSFINPFHDHLSRFLLHSIEEATISIGLLYEIKSILGSSSHIPLIGGSISQTEETLQEVLKYLTWSDVVITTQLVILKISQTIIFKIALVLSLASLFITSYRSFGLKIIILLLLINPGVSAYVTVTKYIADEMKLDNASGLHNQIQEIHQKYQEKEKERKINKIAEEKSSDSKLNKLEKKVLNDGKAILNKVEEISTEGLTIIKSGAKELLVKSINYAVTVAIQFLLLPFLYLYVLLQIVKRLLSANAPPSFIQKIAVCLLIGILISLSIIVLGKEKNAVIKEAKPEKVATLNATQTQTSPVLGIDVSHFQGNVNWDDIKAAGITFAYAKATQGTGFVDPEFDRNWSDIKENGLLRGSYHFFISNEDPVKQAELFIKTVGEISRDDLPPVLDLEQGGMKGMIEVNEYSKNVFIWLKMVEKAFGKKPIIYTDHPFGNQYLTDPKFGTYHLWIADWTNQSEPKIPTVWNGKWTIWQRSEDGDFVGAKGNVDHDLFNGSKEELMKLR